MSGKANKLISQESREDYGEEATEGATALSQVDKEFDGADDKFEEACTKENAFDAAHAEDSAVRSRSQRAGNMARYVTGMGRKKRKIRQGIASSHKGNLSGKVTAGQKKLWRGHAHKGQGTWPGMRRGLRASPMWMKEKKMRQGIANSRQGTFSGQLTAGETKMC